MYIYMYANIHVCLLERAWWTNANNGYGIITQPEPKPLLFHVGAIFNIRLVDQI